MAGTTHTGIRFNPGGGTNGTTAEKSYVTDFIVTATNTNTRGVESYGTECSIGPGSIEGCATGVLTGTTGTDDNFTIASVNGGLYFENRTGSTKQFVLTFFGER